MHCAQVYCVYTVEEPVELWVEESGVPAVEPAGECIYSDIVQRSASEQTHMSHCIWYSKQM